MAILLGNFALVGALLAAALGTLAVWGAWVRPVGLLKLGRISLLAIWGLLTLASIMLVQALLASDFRLEYVARFTERALPTGYKLAAFWAGQEGSLLLWAWVLATMGLIWVATRLRKRDAEEAVATGVLCVVLGFFAALMLLATSPEGKQVANPFRFSQTVPADGRGLNPMLQDPAMIAHPPTLFIGYAGTTIPFVMLIGALMAGRRDNQWLAGTRRWLIASWAFLTVGIILGSWWAYVELGWGGYWAWDPVENASLLPWLTVTAALHSIMVQQQRGMLKIWNAVLLAESFALCVFGTWITRSGIIDSVHSFGRSPVGDFCFAFLVICALLGGGLILVRLPRLRSEHRMEAVFGREGMFLGANVLLQVMVVVTAVGTLFPAISPVFTGQQITVKQSFYNLGVLPMGLLLMGMMAVGPLLSYGKAADETLFKRLLWPAVTGAVVVVALAAVWRLFSPWTLASGFVIGVAVGSLVLDLVETIVRRARGFNENLVLATLRVIDGNHRRYGGQIVHVGTLMLLAGLVGSSLYENKHELMLTAGGPPVHAGGYTAQVEKFTRTRGPNYVTYMAHVKLTDRATGEARDVTPERRFYDKTEGEPNSEVSIWTGPRRDAYVMLAGWEGEPNRGAALVGLILTVKPLTLWLWIGGIVMTLGALICMLPRLIPGFGPQAVVLASGSGRAGASGETVYDAEPVGVVTVGGPGGKAAGRSNGRNGHGSGGDGRGLPPAGKGRRGGRFPAAH